MILRLTYHTRVLLLILITSLNTKRVDSQITQSLTLGDCIKSALAHDVHVKSLENFEMISLLNKRIEQTALLPALGANGGYTMYVQNSSISYIDNVLPTSTILDARSTQLSGSLTASMDIIALGRGVFTSRAANFEHQVRSIENVRQINALIIQVADLYTNCVISELTVKQLSERVNDSESLLKIAETNLSSGAIDSAQYLIALVNYENDNVTYSEAELELQELRENFANFLGLPYTSSITFTTLEALTGQFSEYIERSESQSFELAQARLGMKQVRNQKRANFFGFIPSITFFGGYSLSDQRFQNGIFARNKAFGPTYGLSISYNFRQVKNAVHRSRIHALNLENLELDFRQKTKELEIKQRYLAVRDKRMEAKLNSKKTIANASKRALDKVKLNYELGQLTITDVRNAQNQLLVAEIDLVNTRKEQLITRLQRFADIEPLLPLFNL